MFNISNNDAIKITSKHLFSFKPTFGLRKYTTISINININDAIDLINNYKSNNPRYEWFKDEIISVLEELIKYI